MGPPPVSNIQLSYQPQYFANCFAFNRSLTICDLLVVHRQKKIEGRAVNSTSPVDANNSIRFCIRSYIAFVLAPQAPVIEWLAQLDNWTRNSPGFFAGRPVVLDLSIVKLGRARDSAISSNSSLNAASALSDLKAPTRRSSIFAAAAPDQRTFDRAAKTVWHSSPRTAPPTSPLPLRRAGRADLLVDRNAGPFGSNRVLPER